CSGSPRVQIVGLNRGEGVMASARKGGPGADGAFPAPVGGRRAVVLGEGVSGGGQRVKREEGRGQGRVGRELAETVLTRGRGGGGGRSGAVEVCTRRTGAGSRTARPNSGC